MAIFVFWTPGINQSGFTSRTTSVTAHGEDAAAALCPQQAVGPSLCSWFHPTVEPAGGPRLLTGDLKRTEG